MPYNGSIFDIRNSYAEVFEELAKDEPYQEIARQDVNTRVYKIKYTLNLLPKMCDDNAKLMDMLGDSEDIEVFNTNVV